jgi:hypothetical protein
VESYQNDGGFVESLAESAYDRLLAAGVDHGTALKEAIKIVVDLFPSMVDKIAGSLHRSKPALVSGLAADRRRLLADIEERWGNPFRAFEVVAYMAYELGAELNELSNQEDETSGGDEVSANLIALLHGRACTTADEVLCLMRNGFANGAAARQRTLHELAVTITLIVEDSDQGLAERYAAYSYIEQYQDAQVYQERAPMIQREPLAAEEFTAIERDYQDVLRTYGDSFRKRNQWAAPLFPAGEDITFARLEKAAGLDHLRPFYRFANHEIHAGARAAVLNLHVSDAYCSIGAGARSDTDFGEVGHAALISLVQATVPLMRELEGLGADLDVVLKMQILLRMLDDAGKAFLRASRR